MNIDYSVIRRKGKTAVIRISSQGKITVSVPPGWTDEKAAGLVISKETWIRKHLALITANASKRLKAYAGHIIYLGKIYTFQNNISMGRFTRIDTEKNTIISGCDLEKPENAAKFYKEQARFILPSRVARMAEKNGFKFAKVSVRDNKKRWGSCTSHGMITLSERLILAPVFVIDAIAVHELVHTEIMNHSKDFYARLKSIYPRYGEAELWLKEKFPADYPPAQK